MGRIRLDCEKDQCPMCRARIEVGVEGRLCRDCGAGICTSCRMISDGKVLCVPCAPEGASRMGVVLNWSARKPRTAPQGQRRSVYCRGCGKHTHALDSGLCLQCYFDPKEREKVNKLKRANPRKRHKCKHCGAPSTARYCADCLVDWERWNQEANATA